MAKKAKNEFKKDLFKLLNNAIFAKKNIDISSLQQPKQEGIIWYQSQSIIHQSITSFVQKIY